MKNLRIWGILILAALMATILTWQYFHDGVPSHHIMQRSDLPEISNWWGLVIIPALAWITLSKIQNRITAQGSLQKSVLIFLTGLALGISLAISFNNNYEPFLDNVLYIILGLSLVIPIFLSEFILGFVLAMTLTFGAILPTVFVLIISLVGFIIFRITRLLWSYVSKSRAKE